jgi:hypothetical protein
VQKVLNSDQIAAFYHSGFVAGQVAHFKKAVHLDCAAPGAVVVDVGGGCGYFARAIKAELNAPVRVIDTDPVSVRESNAAGIEAFCENALDVRQRGDEGVVCFNLILHHLVADSEGKTKTLQLKALEAWKTAKRIKLFVNEYVYESYIGNFSGWLIYQITKSRVLSSIGKIAAIFAPSLRANTFGVGVRFRSHGEWRRLFLDSGFVVTDEVVGEEETVSLPRRLLLIKSIRRDSFLLEVA